MRTMVLSTWWALMKRRIGDAMSAGVRERSRASEWVLESENPQLFLGFSLIDAILTDLQYTVYTLPVRFIYYEGTYEQIRFINSIPK